MKILVDHSSPYLLAHGGYTQHIDQTVVALRAIGVDVEYTRWWDHGQRGDLIHYFAPVQVGYLRQARAKGIPVVLTTLLDSPANQPRWQWRRRRLMQEVSARLPLIGGVRQHFFWQTFRLAARNVITTHFEKAFAVAAYGVDPAAIEVVPLGVGEAFRRAGPGPRDGDYLVCTATIAPRKRVVELARLARAARVPVLFVGRPYSEADPYWQEFARLIDGRHVRHDGAVADEAALIDRLQHARGFVFLSRVESTCLAVSEAIACGLPLLLPRLNWAVERAGDKAAYFPDDHAGQVAALRDFYERCPGLPPPDIRLPTWEDMGRQLRDLYRSCLGR